MYTNVLAESIENPIMHLTKVYFILLANVYMLSKFLCFRQAISLGPEVCRFKPCIWFHHILYTFLIAFLSGSDQN